MTKIKILPESISNKIAAGEVVQRPESVVKELIENSIDAGARNIELIIKRAGKSLIQVVDDGSGMTEEDALLCFHKHATSKITKFEDLESINTLGFRGEALSAVSAVAQIEIKTETKDDEVGTVIRIDEPGEILKEKGSFPKGTSIAVKNLFYNVPARRSFLRSDMTEFKHILNTFNRMSLSRPDIGFKLYNEGDLVFNYREGSLEDRIKQVFADNMLEALIHVNEQTEFISLSGYIGKPVMLGKSRGEQYLFLNNRYIVSKQVNHAVFSAYENVLEKGDYPFFILFLDTDPSRIDINIHPSKLEARFEDERDIYNFALAVIRKSLGTHDLVPAFGSFTGSSANNYDNAGREITTANFSGTESRFSEEDIERIFGGIPDSPSKGPFDNPESKNEITASVKTSGSPAGNTFIVQLQNKYILSQIKTGLMVIDQNAAHQRILYEKALTLIDADMPFSQQLMFPKTLEFSPSHYALIKQLNPLLTKLGFEIKFFSRNTIVIEGLPEDIKQGSEERVLREMLDQYIMNQKESEIDQNDNLARSYSSKTAIMAGERLTESEMRLLIDQLFATSMPFAAPGGRPVLIKIPLAEFDHRFGHS